MRRGEGIPFHETSSPFSKFYPFQSGSYRTLPRISIPSRVDEVLELDTLLQVGSCVILRIQSFLVLRHPTTQLKDYGPN